MIPKLTGGAVVAIGVVATGYYLWSKRQALVESINPASPNNVVYKGLNSSVGEDTVANAADKFFGAITLINPFADPTTRAYAKKVYGIGQE